MKTKFNPFVQILLAIIFAAILSSCAERERADIARLRSAAESGDIDAQFTLAKMYTKKPEIEGDLPQNYWEAAQWCKKAADQGSLDAQLELAYMYFWGKGVLEDRQKGITMLKMLAENGYAKAQFHLAMAYSGTSGRFSLPESREKGREWMGKAAANGYPAARIMQGGYGE